MATEEEIIAAGKLLCKAYNIGIGHDASHAEERAREVSYVSNTWCKQAQALANMGHPLVGAEGFIAGRSVYGVAVVRAIEQQLENIKTTLESLEKAGEPNKKELRFLTFASHVLGGREEFEQRGVVERLKDAL